jgi:hypothetical protein
MSGGPVDGGGKGKGVRRQGGEGGPYVLSAAKGREEEAKEEKGRTTKARARVRVCALPGGNCTVATPAYFSHR